MNIANFKDAYISKLNKDGFTDKADEVSKLSQYDPVFQFKHINPEDVPAPKQMDYIADDIIIDIMSLDGEIIEATDKYVALLNGVTERINNVTKRLKSEKQRLDDVNMICSAYNGISNAISLTEDDMGGNFSYDSTHTFSCYTNSNNQVAIIPLNVSGNGYAGNKYVLDNDGNFISDTVDTSLLTNLTDGSALTSFEYSRLCGKSIRYTSDVNIDSVAALCTITFSAGESLVNTIRISADTEGLIIKDILVSPDNGRSFYSSFNKAVKMNDSTYDNFDYINGSGLFCFPSTNVFKLVLQCDDSFDESLSYEDIKITDDSTESCITTMFNTIRKVISINQIKAYFCSYNTSTLTSKELVDENIELDTIAIFCNEYIPSYFESGSYIKYTLVINGTSYNIEPINSNKGGTKVISCSKYGYESDSSIYIDETIKSAQLIITLYPYDTVNTPYISNLKICTKESEVV